MGDLMSASDYENETHARVATVNGISDSKDDIISSVEIAAFDSAFAAE